MLGSVLTYIHYLNLFLIKTISGSSIIISNLQIRNSKYKILSNLAKSIQMKDIALYTKKTCQLREVINW